MMPELILTADELQTLTGRSSKRPALQLAVLLQRGFWRAHVNAGGRLVVERAHYEAVCQGDTERKRPQITPPRSLMRAAG